MHSQSRLQQSNAESFKTVTNHSTVRTSQWHLLKVMSLISFVSCRTCKQWIFLLKHRLQFPHIKILCKEQLLKQQFQTHEWKLSSAEEYLQWQCIWMSTASQRWSAASSAGCWSRIPWSQIPPCRIAAAPARALQEIQCSFQEKADASSACNWRQFIQLHLLQHCFSWNTSLITSLSAMNGFFWLK